MGVMPLRVRSSREANPEPARLQEVLDTAALMFSTKGFQSTSLSDIGDALGMNKASLYHYVRSKDDLLYRLILRASRHLRDVSEGPGLRDLPADQVLERLVREHCRVVLHHRCEMSVLVHQRHHLNLDADSEIVFREKVYVDFLKSTIARGVRDGIFGPTDPSMAAQLILDVVNGLMRWYRPDGRASREDVTSLVWRHVFGALAG